MLLKVLGVLLASSIVSQAAITISGTALLNTSGVADGDLAVFLVSVDGTSFNGSSFNITEGADLTNSSTYGPSFTVITTEFASEFFGNISVSTTTAVSLTGGIDTGDAFGILTFDGGSTNASAGVFEIWTAANWDMPLDGITENFDIELTQLNSVGPSFTGTVVPEPSSFALLAGCFGLAWVMVRRRA